jgi:tRNA G18 (ribose-2'-O)-methylase SpoU
MPAHKRHPITVILEDIRSALNVGAIFRTSDGAWIEKLYLTGITPYPPHNRIPKTALGSIETVPWEHSRDSQHIVEQIAKQMPVIAIELTDDAEIYTDFDFPAPAAIILGNEITGVSDASLKQCTKVVKIPMYGSKESLNVATAYGIVVYEIIRQYKFKKLI